MKALISVSDKQGIVEFARELHQLGVQLISTGGTAKLLEQAGLPVTEVAQLTGFPEMMDGRVKTLHPKIHGGLLARSDVAEHVQAMQQHQIERIDILVVNLYPFEATVAAADCTLAKAIENIDIGGPAMVRSGAKNWQDVAVVTAAEQYQQIINELKQGGISKATRFALAVAAFNRISCYDAAIANYLSAIGQDGAATQFSGQLNLNYQKVQDLRYGENPHQQAAFYRELEPAAGSLATAQQLGGKELSYNNIADADAAWECVKSFSEPACVIIKHANPCGVAVGNDIAQAYSKAFKTDSTSAFGGIIAFNRTFDELTAQQVVKQFVEVIIAPDFTAAALAIFKTKPNVRLVKVALESQLTAPTTQLDFKRVGGGLLVQTGDGHVLTREEVKVVSQLQPTAQQWQDLLFAWSVAKYVKSNAIVFCKDGMTLGVGAGQMSRIDSAKIAKIKAENAGLSLQGSAVASDAFFPFRDGLDVVVDAGASCVIHPGGSIRDAEVIQAADERGVVMVFTGVRHFRH